MENDRAQRFDEALSSLVDNLVLPHEDADEATADEKHEEAFLRARSIIEDYGPSSVVSDAQHAADIIKKKLLRQHTSPEKAVQFSNLYSRLLSQPVLSKKWEILHLLHLLSDGQAGEIPPDGLNLAAHPTTSKSRVHEASNDQIYRDAFASGGLPRMSDDLQRARQNHSSSVQRAHRGPRAATDRTVNGDDSEPTAKVEAGKPTETALLRDLPFILQGLSTTDLSFTADSRLQLPSSLPLPIVSILHTLAEPSLLYRRLSEFVESKDEGLIAQSLRSAVQNELRSYLGLISALETQIRQSIQSLGDSKGTDSRKVGVTLKRCVLWTREATMALRFMSVVVEEAKTRKGGQLISMIHEFCASHGDPFIAEYAERMLTHVTQPWYAMLRRWIYDGELSDPYHEFFVLEQGLTDSGDDPRRVQASSVWEEKYTLNEAMVPSIVTEKFAHKVFLIGKSLNFIRYSCGDSLWVDTYSKDASRELRYGDTAALETSIDEAYKRTMARLTHLMETKFKLLEHLGALKRYLLLGQGDFIALLMESLSTNLDRPAGSQYRHTLTSQLEHAIRGSNAQYDAPDILRRLDARLTEMERGNTGWDVFTLEYKVDAPVDVIITPWANIQYLKIFNLLWRIKRVEFALGSTWRRCMTGARGVLSNISPNMAGDWKRARCAIAEMVHFVDQLQYYILFEVIEASWNTLCTALAKPDSTLDDLISAHGRYLQSITQKGLLGTTRNNSGHREDIFTTQLHELLKLMLSYKDAVDGLYSYSLAEFTRKQELAAKIETRTAQGKWGLTEKDEDELNSPSQSLNRSQKTPANREGETDSPFPITSNPLSSLPSDEESMLPALRNRLKSLSTGFKTRINTLLGDLSVQPDVNMKFLAVVMNFNDVYQPTRRKRRHGTTGATAEKKTPGPANANATEATGKKNENLDGRRTNALAEQKPGGPNATAGKPAAMTKGKEKDKEKGR